MKKPTLDDLINDLENTKLRLQSKDKLTHEEQAYLAQVNRRLFAAKRIKGAQQ